MSYYVINSVRLANHEMHLTVCLFVWCLSPPYQSGGLNYMLTQAWKRLPQHLVLEINKKQIHHELKEHNQSYMIRQILASCCRNWDKLWLDGMLDWVQTWLFTKRTTLAWVLEELAHNKLLCNNLEIIKVYDSQPEVVGGTSPGLACCWAIEP